MLPLNKQEARKLHVGRPRNLTAVAAAAAAAVEGCSITVDRSTLRLRISAAAHIYNGIRITYCSYSSPPLAAGASFSVPFFSLLGTLLSPIKSKILVRLSEATKFSAFSLSDLGLLFGGKTFWRNKAISRFFSTSFGFSLLDLAPFAACSGTPTPATAWAPRIGKDPWSTGASERCF